MIERVGTGASGLDILLNGGIPAGSSVLVTGTCGTGKSLLSLQFLVAGALAGEPGLYIAFEESVEKIIEHGRQFGWDIKGLMDDGLLEILEADTEDIAEILGKIHGKKESLGAKRLVLDSLTTMMEHGAIYRSNISKEMGKMFSKNVGFGMPSESQNITRKEIYHIVKQINNLGVTSILISEVAEKSDYLSRDTISEFAVDGVILLEINTLGGSPERLLSVKKMRGTPVDLRMSVLEFMPDGLTVKI